MMFELPSDFVGDSNIIRLALLVALGLAIIVRSTRGHEWRHPVLRKSRAPPVVSEGYSFLGMLRFFTARDDFCRDAMAATRSGHFSFFCGSHKLIGVSGIDGRRVFYERKELDLEEAYAAFFTSMPGVCGPQELVGDTGLCFSKWSAKVLVQMMRDRALADMLPTLCIDAQGSIGALLATCHDAEYWSVMDPFDDLYRIFHLLTMRAFGPSEVTQSPVLLDKTLSLFTQIEAANPPSRIIFPWLPTIERIKLRSNSQRLYALFSDAIKSRNTDGQRCRDVVQDLLETTGDERAVVSFILVTIFGGLFNGGLHAVYVLVYLACHPKWYEVVRSEVDAVVSSHRASVSQSRSEILAGLKLGEWETLFPMLNLCLRECIRLHLVGTGFRKNVSDRDVQLGTSGEVIPPGAFAVYLVGEAHMDPDVYSEPERWDPGRYLPGRAEDTKQPLSWLGWGHGRHPCLGMRFAKLETAIVGAMFIAMFDYHLVDLDGRGMDTVPAVNRNHHAVSKPDFPIRMRYRTRHSES
ncbi:cytochrome p450 [Colletotrichum plurivorum]|uniref:Cytochrome p450 n=1 Tax=Colletotrichum plurivorum TaxID=2175906 RepID=A0A8H6NLF3_9PEZI|nr:cytochrome p450 [Colletotrichum plurivorum]